MLISCVKLHCARLTTVSHKRTISLSSRLQPGLGGLPPGLSHAMDQMKGMGVAPHLNPAFLQEMAAQGNPGAKGVQNMVSVDTKLLFDLGENIVILAIIAYFGTCSSTKHIISPQN